MYMMLMHEIHALELWIEMKFELWCILQTFFQYAVQIPDFHLSTSHNMELNRTIPIIYRLIIDLQSDQFQVDLIAQLVMHCTATAEVRVRIPLRPSSLLCTVSCI